jgi:hypothetical protein
MKIKIKINLNFISLSLSTRVEFVVNKEPIGSGGFRQVFEATSQTKGFDTKKWVVKKYLAKTVADIEFLQQTVETHTKKLIQMHNLARNFTARLKQEVEAAGNADKFGTALNYNKAFLVCVGMKLSLSKSSSPEISKSTSRTR